MSTTSPDTASHAGNGHHEPHAVPLYVLFGIFAALMVLTVITVAVTTIDFGYNANLVVALSIAVVKSTLVGLYFMHLRYESPLYGMVLVVSLVFVGLFIGLSLLDSSEYQVHQHAPPSVQVSPG